MSRPNSLGAKMVTRSNVSTAEPQI